MMGDDLVGPEARTQTQCDDAARRSTSNEIEGITDCDAQILLQTRKHMRGEQRLRAPSVECEDLEAVGARPGRLGFGCWMDLRGGFASSPRRRILAEVGGRCRNYIHVTRLRRWADKALAVIDTWRRPAQHPAYASLLLLSILFLAPVVSGHSQWHWTPTRPEVRRPAACGYIIATRSRHGAGAAPALWPAPSSADWRSSALPHAQHRRARRPL